MSFSSKTVITDALLRFIMGAAASILVGYLLYQDRIFQGGLTTHAHTIFGAEVALVYAIYRIPHKNLALALAFLIAVVMSFAANRNGLAHFLFLTAMPWATIFLCDLLIRWKDVRPARGKLVLLGPTFALVCVILTLVLALLTAYRGWLKPLLFETLLFFNIGVSLGLGFELAEYLLSIVHRNRRLERHLHLTGEPSDAGSSPA